MEKIITAIFCLILIITAGNTNSYGKVKDEKSGTAGVSRENTSAGKNTSGSSSKVCYSIAKATGVRITIFDVYAREVATVVNQYQQPGSYEAGLNNLNLPAGTYYYKIQTGDNTQVNKIVLE